VQSRRRHATLASAATCDAALIPARTWFPSAWAPSGRGEAFFFLQRSPACLPDARGGDEVGQGSY